MLLLALKFKCEQKKVSKDSLESRKELVVLKIEMKTAKLWKKAAAGQQNRYLAWLSISIRATYLTCLNYFDKLHT